MEIVHVVVECQPGRFVGGVSKVAYFVAKAQASSGHNVSILSIGNRNDCFRDHGINFYTFAANFTASLRLAWFILNKPNVDVIHSHNTYHQLNFLALFAAKLRGKKIFYHPHGALDPELVSGFSFNTLKKYVYIHMIESPLLSASSGVYALNQYEADALLHWSVSSPIFIVPNGIVPPSKVKEQSLGSRILYIGRINPKKNIEEIICALAVLRKRGVRCALRIVGDYGKYPEYFCTLRQLALDLKVSDQISWEGFKDELGKVTYLESGDIFVHSSHSEGMAMAVLEAMSYGLPCIVSKGCHMETAAKYDAVIDYGCGKERLAEEIYRLLQDDGSLRKSLGLRGLEYVNREHAWENIADEITSHYT